MSPSALINGASSVIGGAVCITLRAEIPVHRPPIIDDRNAGFDPCLYNGQRICPERELETFYGMALNTTKTPIAA